MAYRLNPTAPECDWCGHAYRCPVPCHCNLPMHSHHDPVIAACGWLTIGMGIFSTWWVAVSGGGVGLLAVSLLMVGMGEAIRRAA